MIAGAAPAYSAADLAVLQRLPGLCLRLGYVDAYQTHGILHLRRAVQHKELSALPASLQPLMRLLALGDRVPRGALPLAEDEIGALLRLGVLIEEPEGGVVHSGGLVLLPVLGQMAFVPSSPANPFAFFGDDSKALLARMAPPRGGRGLSLCAGVGLFALRASQLCREVVAVEENTVALACLELNTALNSLGPCIKVRAGKRSAALQRDERFDYVVASPSLLPFPPELFAPEGSAVSDEASRAPTEDIVHALPGLLGTAGLGQLVGTDLGDAAGPRLLEALGPEAERLGLSIIVTVMSSTALTEGTAVLRVLAATAAQAAGLQVDQAAERIAAYLGATGYTRLSLLALTISAAARRPGVQVSRYDTLGKGFWFR